MKKEYKKDLNKTYLIIEAPETYEEDYQICMLEQNNIPGILRVSGRGYDDVSQYYYDISGKVSIKAMYEKAKIKCRDLVDLLEQLLRAIKNVQSYLLNTECLVLDPEYIFYAAKEFCFCYYPLYQGDPKVEFHKLTEYFVSQVDYEDQRGIYIAYQLHKLTMEENYSVEQVIEQLTKEMEEKEEPPEQEETYMDILEEDDWITPQEMGIRMVKEKRESWGVVRRMLHRKKKPKWGEWDILDEEEE